MYGAMMDGPPFQDCRRLDVHSPHWWRNEYGFDRECGGGLDDALELFAADVDAGVWGDDWRLLASIDEHNARNYVS